MAKLTKDQVLKLAQLSRLKLTDDEIEKFQVQLSEILDYVEILDKVDTTGLEPTYQVNGLTNVMRTDEIKPYRAKPADLMAGAPKVKDNQFQVKRVLG